MSLSNRSLFCAIGLFSALAAPARAEPPAGEAAPRPETENGRFSMTPVTGGFLRLDTRTGQTSLCSVSGEQPQCRASADERAALEAEIARLAKENAELKTRSRAPQTAQDEEDRKFDRNLDRAETFMRRMLRLFREQADKPSPPTL